MGLVGLVGDESGHGRSLVFSWVSGGMVGRYLMRDYGNLRCARRGVIPLSVMLGPEGEKRRYDMPFEALTEEFTGT